jgi:hypothetical protein
VNAERAGLTIHKVTLYLTVIFALGCPPRSLEVPVDRLG